MENEYEFIGFELSPTYKKPSWIALSKQDFFKDMKMSKDEIVAQFKRDFPREIVYLQGKKISHGEVLLDLLHKTLKEEDVYHILSLCTQTALALPFTALSNYLPENHFLGEIQNASGSMTIKIKYYKTKIGVQIIKPLRIVEATNNKIIEKRTFKIIILYFNTDSIVKISFIPD